MDAELNKKERRFINIIVFGIILLVIGLATIFTFNPAIYVPLIVCGLIVVVIMIISINRIQRKQSV